MDMVNMFTINGIGLWVCAAVLMAVTIVEQRAILRGQRPKYSWLAQFGPEIRDLKHVTWIFLGIPVVSIVARALHAGGHLVFLPIDFWLIVGVFFPLRLAFVHMDSAAQWAHDATGHPRHARVRDQQRSVARLHRLVGRRLRS
jgi:hypothetical protein